MKTNKTLWITTTAALIALLIGLQALSAAMGQLVTGSLVNTILIVSVSISGLYSGLTVALVSPVAAKLIGIGPLWTIIPLMMAGNATLVLVWHFFGKLKFSNKHVIRIITAAVAAVCKFLVLFVGIVKVAVPYFLNLPAPQAGVISNMFSIPQLFTALIGGAAAIALLPLLENAVKRFRRGE